MNLFGIVEVISMIVLLLYVGISIIDLIYDGIYSRKQKKAKRKA